MINIDIALFIHRYMHVVFQTHHDNRLKGIIKYSCSKNERILPRPEFQGHSEKIRATGQSYSVSSITL